MSNKRDNSPELDYFELRRRHAEYKSRARMEQNAARNASDEKAERFAAPEEEQPLRNELPAEELDPRDSFEEAIEEGYEDYEDEVYEDEVYAEGEQPEENPNPFGSFISFFNGVKDAKKPRGKMTAEDLSDEEIEALAAEEGEGIETGFDDGEDTFVDDGEEFEEDENRKGGFKKFMSLFVERIDEDEEEEDEIEEIDEEDFDSEEDDFDGEEAEEIDEEEEEEAPKRKGFFGLLKRKKEEEEEDEEEEISFEDEAPAAPRAAEHVQAAPAAETSGMTRRERRELAMRLAAEEAARKAEEAPAENALSTELEQKAEPVDMAAFENAPEPDILVETTAEETAVEEAAAEEVFVEEPTREFKPVSMRDVESAEESLFDTDEDEEDDEEEEEVKKPRFSLFGRRKARVEEDDEDEDDEDDADDEDEDEDESYDEGDDDEDEDDEEEEVKKPRRGLFGRRKAKTEDEDEDEEEEDEYEDDEPSDDDYDEDDEYDEYDDDEEDDYDEDEYDEEDDSRRSFGHHLLGVIKVILGIVVLLLVLLVAMNFHYYLNGSNFVIDTAHDILGDSSTFDVLCPSYAMRANLVIEEAPVEEIVIEVEATAEPTALPAPEATAVVPNLDTNDIGGEVSAEAEPAIEEVPAEAFAEIEELPVEEPVITEGAVG